MRSDIDSAFPENFLPAHVNPGQPVNIRRLLYAFKQCDECSLAFTPDTHVRAEVVKGALREYAVAGASQDDRRV